MYCDLEHRYFDPKINTAHPWLIGSLNFKFHDNKKVKGQGNIALIRPFFIKCFTGEPTLIFSKTKWKQETAKDSMAGL